MVTAKLSIGDAQVTELDVEQCVALCLVMSQALETFDNNLLALIGHHALPLLDAVSDSIILPDGYTLRKLKFSDIETIWAKFHDVNVPFLNRIQLLTGLGTLLGAMPDTVLNDGVSPDKT